MVPGVAILPPSLLFFLGEENGWVTFIMLRCMLVALRNHSEIIMGAGVVETLVGNLDFANPQGESP